MGQIHYLYDLTGQNKDKISFIEAIFARSQQIQNLITEVLEKGDITIEFIPKGTRFYPRFGGNWTPVTRTIRIASDLEALDMASAILFELCNAANPKIQHFSYMNCEQFSNADDYAKAKELAEYNTFIRSCRLMLDYLNTNQDFTRELIKISGIDITYEELLAEFEKESNVTFNDYYDKPSVQVHTEYYRQNWMAYQEFLLLSPESTQVKDGWALFKAVWDLRREQELLPKTLLSQYPNTSLLLEPAEPENSVNKHIIKPL